MRKNNITYSMNRTIAVAGTALRKTFARFFGQGVSSLFFRPCIPKVNIIGTYAPYRQIASGGIRLTSLLGFRIEFRQLNIKRREYATIHSVGFHTFVG
jgi:hypothetical protein